MGTSPQQIAFALTKKKQEHFRTLGMFGTGSVGMYRVYTGIAGICGTILELVKQADHLKNWNCREADGYFS